MNGHSELKLDALRYIQPMELGVKQMYQAAVMGHVGHKKVRSLTGQMGHGPKNMTRGHGQLCLTLTFLTVRDSLQGAQQ